MTKAALEMLARALDVELSEYGITVNILAPDATLQGCSDSTLITDRVRGIWSADGAVVSRWL